MQTEGNLTKPQETAINFENGNLLVSASAGSGKTFVMISRIVRLILEKKAKVKEILAVTYTNLAADEMKQKLIKALVGKISETESEEEIASLKDALSEVPTADFSTFHGFLLRLLRSYFYAVGLDPTFEIADETETDELKQTALDNLFEKKFKEKDEEFLYLQRVLRNKRSDRVLRETVLSQHDYACSEEDFDGYLSLFDATNENFDGYLNGLKEICALKLSSLIPTAETIAKDCTFFNLEKYDAYISAVTENISANLSSLKKGEPTIYPFDMKKPNAKTGDEIDAEISERLKKLKKNLKDVLDEATEWFSSLSDKRAEYLSTARIANGLKTLVKEFDEEFAFLKREENKADFSDLERLTLKLFELNPEILEEVSSRYKYVFADEYQDVNGVQEKILSLLTKDNLFMVGDIKQSIYAFRGCNPEIFAKKYEKYLSVGGGTALSLDKNFRSADKVLSAVNNIFGRVMTKDFGGVDYASNAMSGSGLYGNFIGVAVLHIIQGKKAEKASAEGLYSVLKAYSERGKGEDFYEGILTARIIEEELGKTFYDFKQGRERKIEFGDIAVLTRNSKGFPEKIVKELARSAIPVSSESGVKLLDYPEIKLLVDILKLVSFYADDAPLCSALKSSAGGLLEDELAEIRRPYPRRDLSFKECVSLYEKEGENAEIREKLKDFRQYFEKIRLLSEFSGAGEILSKILKDRMLDIEISAMPLGDLRLKRVEKFIAESFSGGKPLSVNEFLRRIEVAPDKITLSPKGGTNSVKVMSIHASKGLEFPVVIIAGLKRNFSSQDRKEEILSKRKIGVALKYYDEKTKTTKETLARDYFKEVMKLDEIKEEARLFYVATTRAKAKLHLVCEAEIPEKRDFYGLLTANKFADFISLKDMPTVFYDYGDLESQSNEEERAVLLGAGDERLKSEIAKNLSYKYPHGENTTLPVKSAVTRVLSDGAPKTPLLKPALDEEVVFSKSFAEKGTAYHRFMEKCDLSATDIKAEIERLVSSNLLGEEEAKYLSVSSLEKVLGSFVVKSLRGYSLYREQPFMAFFSPEEIFLRGDGKTLVQGVIDLLAVKDGEAVIVDYKTSSKSASLLKAEYETQLSLYALAVEKTLKLKVKKKIILNLLTAESAEF